MKRVMTVFWMRRRSSGPPIGILDEGLSLEPCSESKVRLFEVFVWSLLNVVPTGSGGIPIRGITVPRVTRGRIGRR
jgi:hypothetical protein